MSEIRSLSNSDQVCVVREDGKPPKIRGYAAVFHRAGDPGTEFRIFPGLIERVGPAAFDAAIRENHDVRAFSQHNSENILGRTSAGTLKLSVDAKGLAYEITPPDTQAARDLMVSIERGDVTGSSFGFRPIKTSFTRGQNGEPDIATLEQVRLIEVSPVSIPAYGGTSASVRAEQPDGGSYADWQNWRHEQDVVQARARLVEIDNV